MKFINGVISQIAYLSRREDEGSGGAGGAGGSGCRSDDQFDDERLDQLLAAQYAQHPTTVASVNANMADRVSEMTAQLQRTELIRFDEATDYLSALQAYATSTEEIKLKEIAKMREHILKLKNIIVNSPEGADTDKLDVYFQTLARLTKEVEGSMMKELTLFTEGITKEGDEKIAIRNNLIKQHNYTTLLMDMLLETTGPNELNDTSGNYLGNIDEDVYLKYDEAIKSLKAEYEESIDLLLTDLIDDTEEIDRRTKKLKTSQDEVLGVMDDVATKEKTNYISSTEYYTMWQFLVRNGIEIPGVLGQSNKAATDKIMDICEKAMGRRTPIAFTAPNHPIVYHLKRNCKGGEYVSPYSNSQIKFKDMTVAEAVDIVEDARAFMSTVMDTDEVHILRKPSTTWWYDKLPPRAKVLVSAIESWRSCIQCSKSEGSKIKPRHAIEELEKAGLSKESNKDAFARFFDEANRDEENTKTRDWYATVMLLALGVDESEIDQGRLCLESFDEFLIHARNMHKSMDDEHHAVIDFNVIMQEYWYKEFNTQERRELLNRILLATASDTSIVSMQLMDKLVKAGAVCPCYACEGKERVISALRDWEHHDDKAKELKGEIGKQPSRYTTEDLLRHFEKDLETGMYKILLLMPCEWAHRQKDHSGLSRRAAGEQFNQSISLQKQMNKRLIGKLDEIWFPKGTVLGGHKISMRQSAGKEYHHPTEEKDVGVCDGQLFEILEKINDIAELEAEIEKRIGKGITKHDTAKNDNISQMILNCTDISRLKGEVLIEYIKTRPVMCMDHRLITRVMQKKECMRIFGLINPCIVTKKYIIINREWIKKMNNDKLDKSLFVRKTSDEEIKTKVQELELNVPNRWEDSDLDFDKIVRQMNRMSPPIYKTELTKLR